VQVRGGEHSGNKLIRGDAPPLLPKSCEGQEERLLNRRENTR
jgi:hypothetical protein